MNGNLIQWPRAAYWDKAWNPIVGCKPASPACVNCYARAMARRFKMRGCDTFEPMPTTRQRPPRRGVVFCGNMTDLFGEWLDRYTARDFVEQTIDVSSEKNAYLYLTKRVERMCDALLSSDANEPRLRNHYFGFTAENLKWYNKRVVDWRDKFPLGMNGWVSAEPLLGPIDLHLDNVKIRERIKWIVVGCESGPNRRPCSLSWIEDIVMQSVANGIPVFVKQIEVGGRCVRDIDQFPEHLRIRQVPWKIAETEKAK
jgi:protein gp37